MILKQIIEIDGVIETLSGLRIGGGEGIIEIGGIDSPIIRNPINKQPYIPGSSIKGKMRSLMELQEGKVEKNTGAPHKHHHHSDKCKDNCKINYDCIKDKCPICMLFGASADDKSDIGPGRLIFRDCLLNEESKNQLKNFKINEGWDSEIKTEVSVNRWNAQSSGLRKIERVPAGVRFDLKISIRLFDDDDKNRIISLLKKGIDLIEKDALGGSGSRGYGKVVFNIDWEQYGT
ncbi:MAG: type III-A CRISPR-associated RAMP protein Csm3 [Actinobacteria bacterium]|nr:type III-A CRISPR-associated RAMP protein Csm3 [Actinomycetota bacterium]